jgi:DNA ligase 1
MKYKPDKKYNPDVDWDGEHALPKLYSRSAGGAINTWEVWLDKAGGVVVRWGQKDGALQTTVFQCERKNIGRANATSVVEQARLEAIAKWRKQLKKKYFLTEGETAQLNLKPMLAKSFADRESKVTYPVDVQPKFDGVRCLAFRKDGVVVLQSRGGDPYDVEHIREVLEDRLDDDTVLDGEIYIHGMSLQNIISLVKRPQDGSLKLTYQVYDRTLLSEQTETWVERRDALAEWFRIQLLDEMPWFICGVRTHSALNATKVRLLHDQFVEDGYEGAIIRLYDGLMIAPS